MFVKNHPKCLIKRMQKRKGKPLKTTSKVTMKLLIDTKNNKVLFAEAGKDFVDFLFALMTLPLGTVATLLKTNKMVGCLGDLYGSIQNLSPTYIKKGKDKDSLLKPTLNTSVGPPLLLPITESFSPKIYVCKDNNHKYAANSPNAHCPSCYSKMSVRMKHVSVTTKNRDSNSDRRGIVKGAATYMVMDNLEVSPVSAISTISMLHKFNIQELSALEERTVDFGVTEGLELLKQLLHSKSVLTSVFLGKKRKKRGNERSHLKKKQILVCWEFPPNDWVKLNTDGASKGQDQAASCGGVLRDSSGKWLKGYVANLGTASAVEAEMWGIYYGLNLAWLEGYRKIVVSTDSSAALHILRAEIKHSHPLAPLIVRCRDLLGRNWVIRLEHTFREGNKVADKLANWGITKLGLHVLEVPPSICIDVLSDDQKGVSFPRMIPV